MECASSSCELKLRNIVFDSGFNHMKNVPTDSRIFGIEGSLYPRYSGIAYVWNTFKFKLVKAEKFLDVRPDNTTVNHVLN